VPEETDSAEEKKERRARIKGLLTRGTDVRGCNYGGGRKRCFRNKGNKRGVGTKEKLLKQIKKASQELPAGKEGGLPAKFTRTKGKKGRKKRTGN